MKLKKGDEVKIIKGKDKGKTGKVEKVFPKKNSIIVNGINQYKRHLKARSQNQPSEIISLTLPMPESNAMLICPKCHLKTRIGFKIENKEKRRICRKCQGAL